MLETNRSRGERCWRNLRTTVYRRRVRLDRWYHQVAVNIQRRLPENHSNARRCFIKTSITVELIKIQNPKKNHFKECLNLKPLHPKLTMFDKLCSLPLTAFVFACTTKWTAQYQSAVYGLQKCRDIFRYSRWLVDEKSILNSAKGKLSNPRHIWERKRRSFWNLKKALNRKMKFTVYLAIVQ